MTDEPSAFDLPSEVIRIFGTENLFLHNPILYNTMLSSLEVLYKTNRFKEVQLRLMAANRMTRTAQSFRGSGTLPIERNRPMIKLLQERHRQLRAWKEAHMMLP